MTVDSSAARNRERLMVLAAAVLFSTGGAAVKACALSGWQVASLRSGIAAIAILALVPSARRRWTGPIWLVGCAYAATMILYVLANKLTTAANAIFLQSTAPLYVLLLGPWLLAERSSRRQLALMAVLAVGMGLFFVGGQPASDIATDPLLGNLLGGGAGLTWALCIMGLRWLGRHDEGVGATSAAVGCGNLIACVVALPVAWPIADARPVDWAIVIFLGLCQIGLAYAFLVRGVRRVPAFEVSLLLLAEPVLNPLWAWLVHDEITTVWAMAGGAIILAATTATALSRPRPRTSS
jgi:drug/metabolite transporter (DMT)-like permease